MSNLTYNDLLNRVKEEIDAEIKSRKLLEEDYLYDRLHEIIDNSIPVYTADLLAVASSYLHLATEIPECGPAFSAMPSPVNLIAGNLYEALIEEAHCYVDTKLDTVEVI